MNAPDLTDIPAAGPLRNGEIRFDRSLIHEPLGAPPAFPLDILAGEWRHCGDAAAAGGARFTGGEETKRALVKIRRDGFVAHESFTKGFTSAALKASAHLLEELASGTSRLCLQGRSGRVG